MSENWAIALYHEWFSLFRHSLKVKVSEDEGVAKLLEDFDSFITEKGFLDRASLNEKNGTVSEELRNEIRVSTFMHLPPPKIISNPLRMTPWTLSAAT